MLILFQLIILKNEIINIGKNNLDPDSTSSSRFFSNIELTISKIFDLTININKEKSFNTTNMTFKSDRFDL